MAGSLDTTTCPFKPGDRVRARGSLGISIVQEVTLEAHPLGAWVTCDKGGGRAALLELAMSAEVAGPAGPSLTREMLREAADYFEMRRLHASVAQQNRRVSPDVRERAAARVAFCEAASAVFARLAAEVEHAG